MDVVLGQSYRGKGVLKYVLTRADEQLRDGVGFRVKNVAAGNDWFVKDTYYVINVLVRTGEGRTGHAFTCEKIPSKANARPPNAMPEVVGVVVYDARLRHVPLTIRLLLVLLLLSPLFVASIVAPIPAEQLPALEGDPEGEGPSRARAADAHPCHHPLQLRQGGGRGPALQEAARPHRQKGELFLVKFEEGGRRGRRLRGKRLLLGTAGVRKGGHGGAFSCFLRFFFCPCLEQMKRVSFLGCGRGQTHTANGSTLSTLRTMVSRETPPSGGGVGVSLRFRAE